jgi:hypothetical protein
MTSKVFDMNDVLYLKKTFNLNTWKLRKLIGIKNLCFYVFKLYFLLRGCLNFIQRLSIAFAFYPPEGA